ncbi:hypothetical protein B0H16DRAFT_823447 [Mycena metata]|uniref:Uncharacterized protein n=1 Tax=Mycena metata TaxID=1033252 RepID=A0AAD7IX93_9AGAR|nr:hypothetical protein B0H16DRAFT_823447 [Mycena metata]
MLAFVHLAAHTTLAVPQVPHAARALDVAADEDEGLEHRTGGGMLHDGRGCPERGVGRIYKGGDTTLGSITRAIRGWIASGAVWRAYTSPSTADTTRLGGFRPSSLFRVFDQATTGRTFHRHRGTSPYLIASARRRSINNRSNNNSRAKQRIDSQCDTPHHRPRPVVPSALRAHASFISTPAR